MTESVVLAVCLAAHSRKAVTLHDSLESFTLGSTDDIHISSVRENICYSKDIA